MTGRDIKAHLEKIYQVEVSPDLISRVTNGVMEEVREWQNRPLEKTCAIMYLDAIRVKAKQDGKRCTKSVYVALGVNFEGQKEVGETKFRTDYGQVKTRGRRTLVRVLDGGTQRFTGPRGGRPPDCLHGLTGFPEAVQAVFPATRIQLCIVHMVHNSTK